MGREGGREGRVSGEGWRVSRGGRVVGREG